MATVLQAPGMRSNQELQQYTTNLQAQAEQAMSNREQMGRAAVEQAQQYADSRGISLGMAAKENPAMQESLYSGLVYANRGNRNMAEKMYQSLLGAKATSDQLFNYQMNKVFDGIDLDQDLFDSVKTEEIITREAGSKTIDGATLDTQAVKNIAGTLGEDTVLWTPFANYVGMEPESTVTLSDGTESPVWGAQFNQIRDGILNAYLGIDLDTYLGAGSEEKKAYNKALVGAMQNSNIASVVQDSVHNVSQTEGQAQQTAEFGSDQSLAQKALWVVQDEKDTYAKLKKCSELFRRTSALRRWKCSSLP